MLRFAPPDQAEEMFKAGLPEYAIVGRLVSAADSLKPSTFARNRVFVDFFQSVISNVAPSMPYYQDAALSIEDGWIEIRDHRSQEYPLSDEDLIGRFPVENGRIIAGQYQPNEDHWVFNDSGMMQPHPNLLEAILSAMWVPDGDTP